MVCSLGYAQPRNLVCEAECKWRCLHVSDPRSLIGCPVQAKRKEIDAAKSDIESNTRRLKTTEGEIATATKSHRCLQFTTKGEQSHRSE